MSHAAASDPTHPVDPGLGRYKCNVPLRARHVAAVERQSTHQLSPRVEIPWAFRPSSAHRSLLAQGHVGLGHVQVSRLQR